MSAIDQHAPGQTTWKSLVQTADQCAATPPTSAADYTEGLPHRFTSEADNGKYVCFWATHTATSTMVTARSDRIGGIDVTPPAITASVSAVNLVIGGTAQVLLTPSENIRQVAAGTGEVESDLELSDLAVYTAAGAAAGDQVGLALAANSNGSYTLTLTGIASPADPANNQFRIELLAAGFADAAGNLNSGVTELLAVTTAPLNAVATRRPTISNPSAGAVLRGPVDVTGGAEPNATVEVTFGTLTQTVTATPSGSWMAGFDTTLLADSARVTIAVVATAPGKLPSNQLPALPPGQDRAAVGRTAPAPVERVVEVDNTAPSVISFTESATVFQGLAGHSARFELSDPVVPARVQHGLPVDRPGERTGDDQAAIPASR